MKEDPSNKKPPPSTTPRNKVTKAEAEAALKKVFVGSEDDKRSTNYTDLSHNYKQQLIRYLQTVEKERVQKWEKGL